MVYHLTLARRQQLPAHAHVVDRPLGFQSLRIAFQRRENGVDHVLIAEWLGEKVYCASLHCLYGHGNVAVGRHEYDGHMRLSSLNERLLEDESALPAEAYIEYEAGRPVVFGCR